MRDGFEFFLIIALTGGVVITTLFLVKEFFTRWINDDWCRHDWPMWGPAKFEWSEGYQLRACKKCNQIQRRKV